jgi:hypothetical protein
MSDATSPSAPITHRIDALFQLARQHSQTYASPEAWLARERQLARHPTALMVMKCMDGHINIPIATGTPRGIIQANMRAGRIPDGGLLPMSSVSYEDVGVDKARAALKSRFLARFAAEVIRRDCADLGPKMSVRESVLNGHQRSLEVL